MIFLYIRLFFNAIYSAITNKKSEIEEIHDIINENLNKPTPYSCMLNIIDGYIGKYNCLSFSKLSEELKQNLSKTIKTIEENSFYYNKDKSINLVAIEQSVVQFLLQYIDARLMSGQFHIYRGLLNDEGKTLLKVYKQLLTELIRLEVRDEDTKEIINTDWVDRNYKSLCEDIKTVGQKNIYMKNC